MDIHSSLSTACRRHFLTFISSGSFSTSSTHLNLGLPLLLLPYFSLALIYLTVLPWSIRTTGPVHSNLIVLTSAPTSRSSYNTPNSWLLLILYIPCSCTSPHIVLSILLTHAPSLFISVPLTASVSLPYRATGLYILLVTALRMALDLTMCLRLWNINCQQQSLILFRYLLNVLDLSRRRNIYNSEFPKIFTM